METLLQDLRFGARTLIKNPGFTVVAVLALALGIGANTAIFSVVNTVLLKSLPYGDPDRLVYVWEQPPDPKPNEQYPASPPNFHDWQAQSRSFTHIAGRMQRTFNLTTGDNPERVLGDQVTDHYFDVLDVRPVVGRFFLPAEADSGNNHVVVLSRQLWLRRFGGDSSIVGRKVMLNDIPFTVVGVSPDEHRSTIELWIPLDRSLLPDDRSWHTLVAVARLKPDVSLAAAQAEMSMISSRLGAQYPMFSKGWSILVIPVHEMIVRDIRPALLILFAAVGFVLLIACANVANLQLSRLGVRVREMAVRSALGAGRGRIIRQLLTESVLLSIVGGAIGVLIAVWGTDAIARLEQRLGFPGAANMTVDVWVLLFALGLSIITGILFGLVPAIHASRTDIAGSLKDGGRSSSAGMRGRRIRNVLVLSEVAFALLLLIGAGLMMRSFVKLQGIEPGFDPKSVLTTQISIPEQKYSDSSLMVSFFREVTRRAGSIPGVESAGIISAIPLGQGGPSYLFSVEGQPLPKPNEANSADTRWVSGDYFRTMKIPVLKGRTFNDHDLFNTQQVAIVSKEMARELWGDRDPIGRRITLGIPIGLSPDSIQWMTVVGMVGDVRLAGLKEAPGLQLYVPYTQGPRLSMTLVARTTGEPMSIVPSLRREIGAVDPDVPLARIMSYEDVMGDVLAQPKLYMFLFGIFAGVALLLAGIGIYGVISQTVVQRTHEIGVRMALGAPRGNVLAMVVRQGMILIVIGLAAGLAGAFALTRLMQALLYGVSATDGLTYLGVAVLLGLVALVACYIPARRAASIDPVNALRHE